jgi:hypothetical protein
MMERWAVLREATGRKLPNQLTRFRYIKTAINAVPMRIPTSLLFVQYSITTSRLPEFYTQVAIFI